MAEEYKVEITAKAEADIDHILRYTLSVNSITAVETILFAIRAKAEELYRFPHSNPLFHTTKTRAIQYRYTIAKKVHRLIYFIEEAENIVYVTKIVHVRANQENIKQSIEEE